MYLLVYFNLKELVEWTQFWYMSLGLIFWIVMQNSAATQSAVLEKMTFEVAIFGKFSDNTRTEIVTSVLGYGRPDVTVVSMYVLQR